MVGYNVYRNDEKLCVAGVGDVGVLTACVTCVARSPEKLARRTADGNSPQAIELALEVGGLKSDDGTRLRWIDTSLRVGDEIRIQVIDASRVDAAMKEYRDDPVKDLEGKKAYVRQLAKELGWEIREP